MNRNNTIFLGCTIIIAVVIIVSLSNYQIRGLDLFYDLKSSTTPTPTPTPIKKRLSGSYDIGEYIGAIEFKGMYLYLFYSGQSTLGMSPIHVITCLTQYSSIQFFVSIGDYIDLGGDLYHVSFGNGKLILN